MLAFGLALSTGVFFAALLANVGVLGSSFEGSSGYIAMLVVAPLLTAVAFPTWRWWIKRWGPLSRTGVWALVGGLVAALVIGSFGAAAVLGWAGIVAGRTLLRARASGQPLRPLFVQNAVDGASAK